MRRASSSIWAGSRNLAGQRRHIHLQARRLRVLHQRSEAVGAVTAGADVGMDDVHQPRHLGECLIARLADARKPLGSRRVVLRSGHASRAGLHHDHREVMGHDVVELAGYPGPLAPHREPHEYVLLGFELARALVQRAHQAAPPPDLPADPPRREGHEEDLDIWELREAHGHLHCRDQAGDRSQSPPGGRMGAARVGKDEHHRGRRHRGKVPLKIGAGRCQHRRAEDGDRRHRVPAPYDQGRADQDYE